MTHFWLGLLVGCTLSPIILILLGLGVAAWLGRERGTIDEQIALERINQR